MDYHVVSQGKTTIPGVDDGEEMQLTDVRTPPWLASLRLFESSLKWSIKDSDHLLKTYDHILVPLVTLCLSRNSQMPNCTLLSHSYPPLNDMLPIFSPFRVEQNILRNYFKFKVDLKWSKSYLIAVTLFNFKLFQKKIRLECLYRV